MSLHSQPRAPRWVLMEGSAPWSILGLGFWPRAPLPTQWSQDSLDLLYDQEASEVGKAPGTVLSAQEVGQRGGSPSGSRTQSRLPGSPAQPLQCIRWTNRPLCHWCTTRKGLHAADCRVPAPSVYSNMQKEVFTALMGCLNCLLHLSLQQPVLEL